MRKPTGKGSGNSIRSQVPEGRFTTAEVARACGRSIDTVKRWREDGKLTPHDSMQFGATTVWLYTQGDIRRAQWLAKALRPWSRKAG